MVNETVYEPSRQKKLLLDVRKMYPDVKIIIATTASLRAKLPDNTSVEYVLTDQR